MDLRLPALAPRFSRTVGITLEILQHRPLAEALHEGLAELASQFDDRLTDRVYVRLPLGGGWLEGWYAPATRELEPIAFQLRQDLPDCA